MPADDKMLTCLIASPIYLTKRFASALAHEAMTFGLRTEQLQKKNVPANKTNVTFQRSSVEGTPGNTGGEWSFRFWRQTGGGTFFRPQGHSRVDFNAYWALLPRQRENGAWGPST